MPPCWSPPLYFEWHSLTSSLPPGSALSAGRPDRRTDGVWPRIVTGRKGRGDDRSPCSADPGEPPHFGYYKNWVSDPDVPIAEGQDIEIPSVQDTTGTRMAIELPLLGVQSVAHADGLFSCVVSSHHRSIKCFLAAGDSVLTTRKRQTMAEWRFKWWAGQQAPMNPGHQAA